MYKPVFKRNFSLLPWLVASTVSTLTGFDPNENVSTWSFFPFYPHFLHVGKSEFIAKSSFDQA